jgi:phenylacetate-coenzyme A ligase PaaK-like adenylate-forming protein
MDHWDKLSFLSLRELKEIQNRKLRHFISRQLYPFSPYYHRLFNQHKIKPSYIKTVEDLSIIPFTQKEDFFPTKDNPDHFKDFILQPQEASIRKYSTKDRLLLFALLKIVKGKGYLKHRLEKEYRPIFLTATAGTSHHPVSFLYSGYDIENLHISGARLLDIFGGKGDIRAVNLFPYAPHLAFWQTVFAGFSHHDFVLSTGGGKVMGTEGNIEAIEKVRPNILIGVPSYVYHLVRSAKEGGRDFSFVQRVILGASAVPMGFKEKLAGWLRSMGAKHIRIVGTYGFTEAKCAWGECITPLKISSGYHTYPDKEVFEVIDPETGDVKREGEDGELVYTNIDARGSCVLRYRTGDLIKGGIVHSRCPYCHRTVPRISSQISRSSNIKSLKLSKIKGALVNLNTFGSILEAEKGIEEWQVQIRKKDNDPFEVDELIIYLSVSRGVDHHQLKEKLNSSINCATEVTPNEIIILPHREMLDRVEIEISNKAKRFVDMRP